MKMLLMVMALTTVSDHAFAQAGALYDAEVNNKTTITDPAEAIKPAEGQWMAFSMPVAAGTGSPCCWAGKWNGTGEAGCSLKPEHESYGTRSDSPTTDSVIVYSQIRRGSIVSLKIVGPQCPMNGHGAQVTWIGDIDNTAGLNWLEALAREDEPDTASDSALYALALHRDNGAGQRLYALAKEQSGSISEEAIFWLGEARGDAGFELLVRLLGELPSGETRRRINFALSQNDSNEAADLLYTIASSDADSEQRGDALFWLAEEYPQRAEKMLLHVISSEQDEDVLEQAVFAVSQLPAGRGDEILLQLAQDKQMPSVVRRQAFFWLANSDDEETVTMLTELLTQ